MSSQIYPYSNAVSTANGHQDMKVVVGERVDGPKPKCNNSINVAQLVGQSLIHSLLVFSI